MSKPIFFDLKEVNGEIVRVDLPLAPKPATDEVRIEGLMQLRNRSFCMGLAMGGETREFMQEHHLIGLSEAENARLGDIIARRMMARCGKKELRVPE